MEGFQRTAVIS